MQTHTTKQQLATGQVPSCKVMHWRQVVLSVAVRLRLLAICVNTLDSSYLQTVTNPCENDCSQYELDHKCLRTVCSTFG